MIEQEVDGDTDEGVLGEPFGLVRSALHELGGTIRQRTRLVFADPDVFADEGREVRITGTRRWSGRGAGAGVSEPVREIDATHLTIAPLSRCSRAPPPRARGG